MKKCLIFCVALLLNSMFVMANADSTKVDSVLVFQKDDPVIAMLDSMVSAHFLQYFHEPMALDSLTDDNLVELQSLPEFSDSVYIERIMRMDAGSPFPYRYNRSVKNYIKAYAERKRKHSARIMGLAELYFPLFEEKLAAFNMPLELKYLAIVESALNPEAVSRAGATGLWQFMYATAKMNGLKINSYVDERCDPYKSTEAACCFMQKLYNIYGDWALVLAAYNSGPGNVNKAIRRSGGKRDYWEIRPYLPRETRGYVPAFIAVSYVMNYAQEHEIIAEKSKIAFYETDTLMVTKNLSFKQLAEVLQISEEEIAFLNPSYKYQLIPGSHEPCILRLPIAAIADFVNNEQLIYQSQTEWEAKQKNQMLADLSKPEPDIIVHKVRSGQVLGSIAMKYGVRVSDIKRWNHLRSDRIRVGQKLRIYSSRRYAFRSSPAKEKKKKIDPNTKYEYYTVRKGDTLWDIAQQFNGVDIDDLKVHNSINARRLQPGDQIKIPLNS